MISTLTCQKIGTKTDQKYPSIYKDKYKKHKQRHTNLHTMTHTMIHKCTITHNDTHLLKHTYLHTLSYTHFLSHTYTLDDKHTACRRVCYIMYHCVSYCQCISFRVFLYYSAFLNARYLEHVIFIRNSLCQFVLHNDFYQL